MSESSTADPDPRSSELPSMHSDGGGGVLPPTDKPGQSFGEGQTPRLKRWWERVLPWLGRGTGRSPCFETLTADEPLIRELVQLSPAARCQRILDLAEIESQREQADAAKEYFIQEKHEPLDLYKECIPQLPNNSGSPRYRLLCPLGGGGFGWTFAAQRLFNEVVDGSHGSAAPQPLMCAVKLIAGSEGSSAALVVAEIRNLFTAANRPHRNVLLLLDFGRTTFRRRAGNYVFIAFPLVQGALSITQYCIGQSLTAALGVIDEMLSGLAHIHGAESSGGLGLCHLDIKPGNVLVDDHGVVRIVDLGLARAAGTLCRAGTRGYASPEQWNQDSISQIGPASDVWAAGLVLHEVLAGRQLGPDRTIDTSCWARKGELTHCQQMGFRYLIEVCTRDSPRCRYPDAAALRAEFTRVGSGLPPASALGGGNPTEDVSPMREDVLSALRAVSKSINPALKTKLHSSMLGTIDLLARHFAIAAPSIAYLREEFVPAAARHYEASMGSGWPALTAVDGLAASDRGDRESEDEFRERVEDAWRHCLLAAWNYSPRMFAAAVMTMPMKFLTSDATQAWDRAVRLMTDASVPQ